MSVVTAVVLMTGLADHEQELLEAVNTFFAPDSPLVWVEDFFGGPKHPQTLVAGAAINYCDEAGFLVHLRALDWKQYDCGWAQVAIKGEHNDGFGLVDLWRAEHLDPAWTPPD